MSANLTRYEEMMSFLPWYYRDSAIMNGIIKGDAEEIEAIREAALHVLKQYFVDTATEDGVKLWEEELGLTPADGASLELRKAQIKAKLQRPAVMTPKQIQSIVNLFTASGGAKVHEVPKTYHFNVEIPFGDLLWKDEMKEALEDAKPAHLGYDIIYTLFDLKDDALDGLDIRGDDLNAFVSAGMRDVVPYGNVLTYPKADGTYKAGGMFSADGTWKADGEHRVGDIIKPGALKLQEGIDWQFIPDGRATADGAYTACGDLKANGERPWILQYNSFMDTFSAIIITMKRPDGTTELEDDVAAVLTAGEGIKANGEARAGKTTLPIDNSGRLTIERAHKADGKLKADGGDINLTNGSILADGSFKADGGGNHARYELYVDDLEGKFSLVKPKKHTPLAWTMPELFDETTVYDGEESATTELNTFEDDASTAGAPFTASGLVKADGGASASAGNLLPFDTGGVLTIIRVLTANGTRKADGGLGGVPTFDGSLKADGKTTAKGGETIGARRHYETL